MPYSLTSSITSHLSNGVQQFEHIPLTHQASRRYVLYAFGFTFWPKRIVVVDVAGLILKKAWIVMTTPIHIFFICSFILWRLAISNISRTGSSCIRARHNSNHAVIAPLAQNSIAVVTRNPCILARVKRLWQQRNHVMVDCTYLRTRCVTNKLQEKKWCTHSRWFWHYFRSLNGVERVESELRTCDW